MIAIVTPNPSVDRTLVIDRFTPGAVHRVQSVRVDPGGKGVNVARALVGAGATAVAVMPAGGAEGARLAELLAPEAVPVVTVRIHSLTRSNVTVVEADGTTSKFNEPGPCLGSAEILALEEAVLSLADRSAWVVSCGSLPLGCPDDWHARVVRGAREKGARVAVDASGPALIKACEAGPCLIKPNLAELADLTGRPLRQLGDVVRAAAAVRQWGVGTVLVSMGQHGAVLVDGSVACHARTVRPFVRSTVGAGDAMLAGFLLAGGSGPAALRTAVAYGAAAVEMAGSRMPTPRDLRTDLVSVAEVDESFRLAEAAI